MRIDLHAMLNQFLRNRRGNVAIVSALAMPVIAGALGLGAETATWYSSQRAMQNAADTAAIAAATNAGASYITEARAVTAQYGFVDGVGGVSVAVSNAAVCPGAGPNCYSVSIQKALPLLLAQIVGFSGDTQVSGSPAKLISATSVALQGTAPRAYCILALGSSGVSTALQSNGAPNANLAGCNVMSNTGATCNGHNLGADFGDAHTTNSGCGVAQRSNVPAVTDPYSGLASNIPTNTCGGKFPQEPAKKKGPALPATNQLSGFQSWSNVVQLCGDLQLTGDVTVDTTGPAVLVIYNGQFDTNGYTFQTTSGSALTVVFSGTNGSYSHAPTGGGTLDIAAPTTGPWAGMVIYQDPTLTTGVDISAAGNSPTWNLTGMVYLPHSSVTFSGAVNKSANGKSCFGLVVDNITINGTADILSQGQCAQAGLALPTGQVPSRGQLVS